jgi:hypothetical protein
MEKTLTTSADIQVKYEHLYKFLMNFLWEFPVVQSIAKLEMAIFKKFPDKDEMLTCLYNLKKDISYTYNELDQDDDPEFKKAMEDLENTIEDYDEENTGCELYAVNEVLEDPRDISASDDMTLPNGKKKFKIGNIKKVTKEERELQEEAARTLQNPFENEEGEEE